MSSENEGLLPYLVILDKHENLYWGLGSESCVLKSTSEMVMLQMRRIASSSRLGDVMGMLVRRLM